MATVAKSKKVKEVTVSICLTEEEGLDINDGGKWLLTCEAHGFILQDTNYRRLWAWASQPEQFCEGCRNAQAEEEYTAYIEGKYQIPTIKEYFKI
jgi:hypothetical protein